MNERVHVLANSMSLQIYVISKKEEIIAEYDTLPPSCYVEEEYHLERLQKEGKEIFEQLKESEAKMAHMREHLRGMYTELKEMCHKPDAELLLVRTQKWGVEHSHALEFLQQKSISSFMTFVSNNLFP